MLSFEPNIVIVDDKKEEVQGILNWYNNKGVGCKFINSDIYEGDSFQEIPYSDVNLIFLDLYYSTDNFDPELCSNWVQSVIPEKSFYILVIWSKDPAKADQVIEELKKLNRLPFCCLIKNKIDFQVESEEKYDYSKLFEEINSEIDNIPSLEEIGVWKKSVKNACNSIIGNLSKGNNPAIFKTKLQKIIVGHGGTSILKEVNNHRKRQVLFDALDRVLISNTKNSILSDDISDININQLYTLNQEENIEVDKELNSWFHFKLIKNIPENSLSPGLISKNNHSLFKSLYSIQDDEKISGKLENLISNNVEIIDIVVILTRPCDVAQGKLGKNIKLISGILIKKPTRTNKGKINFKGGSLPDSVILYDHLKFSDMEDDVAILFDFRYVFSVPQKVFIDKFTNLKVFNKELLSELQVEYSSYSSRLGITQII
ncbi:hypothetical protein [Mesoflavibacter profundi]|uniref:hypothetical protein n=1 Tax=Mesoflavibacter profundi TaxID=2708110 RepID=UPI003381FBA5|nr:hypothetical protein [Mesoflavibacter sp.]